MTGLLPELVRDAAGSESVYAASKSFGVVALVVLVLLLLQQEVLRVRGAPRAQLITHSAVITPLFVAVMLMLGVRVLELAT